MDNTPKEDSYGEFKQAIAEQIAAFASLTVEQIAESIEESKKQTLGDLAVPVAKLNRFKKLNGNPAELAKKWATDVQILIFTYI
jgi:arginyl-tRNA synthetase